MNPNDDMPLSGGDAKPSRNVLFKGEEIPVPEAFWDGEAGCPNVGALVKSHADLRRKLSDQKPQPPEAYALSLPEDLAARIAPDENDPLARGAMEWARRQGLGQEAFSELAALYYGHMVDVVPDRESEMRRLSESLGPRAGMELADLSGWACEMLGGSLAKSPEIAEAFESLTSTANGVLLLKALRDRLGEAGLPSARGSGAARMDAAALRALQSSDAYLAGDPSTRRTVADGWARLFPDERE